MNTSETNPSDRSDADPETVRQRQAIAVTRADMGRTLERIEDRVSPSRIRERQTERVRGRWQQLKSTVMGSDGPGQHTHGRFSDAQDRVLDLTDDAKETIQHLPERVEDTTRGNPLAAGLVAAGLGALAGSLLPVSRPEQRLAEQVRDTMEEPVRSELSSAGHEMAEDLREHARHAAEEVGETARDAVETTVDEVRDETSR